MNRVCIALSFVLCVLFISCNSSFEKGEMLQKSDAEFIWENLYTKTNFDGKRIATEGYISLENYRKRGKENYCELVDVNKNHLLFLTLKDDSKNSLKIDIISENQENNFSSVEINTDNSFILDNNKNQIPFSEKVLISFDIKYSKHLDTGKFATVTVEQDGKMPYFEKFAKKGNTYCLFSAENIRIDRAN